MTISKIIGLTAVGSIFVLSACTSPARFDTSNAPNGGEKTRNGAIIGGIVGAIAGSNATNSADRRKGAIVGAVVGAGAGALIGQRLDQQAADLQRDLGNDQVRIVNTGSELIVTLPQDILFAVDSADVRSDLRRDLGALAQNLLAYPDSGVQVIGHTDNTGSATHNLDLSQRRANAVTSILTQNGVPSFRLRAIGRGEDFPVADNLTDAGRAQNRRVEIIITPQA